MGLLSLFPTHTATSKFLVKPIVQLSLLLSVVPVFTETVCPGILRGEFVPNSKERDLLSERMLLIINATDSGITLSPLTFFSSKTSPL